MDMLSDIRDFSKITNIITLNSYLYGNSLVEIKENIFLSGTNGSGKTTFLNLIPLFLGTRQLKKDSNSYFSGNESSYIIIEYINYQGVKCSLLITQNKLDYQFFFFKLDYNYLLSKIVINFTTKLNFNEKLDLIDRNEIILLNYKHLQDLGLNKNEVVSEIDYSKYKMIIHENPDKKYKALIKHFKFSNRNVNKMGKVMQELLDKKISFKTLKELIINSFLENIEQKSIGAVSIENCDDEKLKNNIDFYELFTDKKEIIKNLTENSKLYLEQEMNYFKYVNFLKNKIKIYKEDLNNLMTLKNETEIQGSKMEKEILKCDTIFNSEQEMLKKELKEKTNKLNNCNNFLAKLNLDKKFDIYLNNKDNIISISNELNSLNSQLNVSNSDKTSLLNEFVKQLYINFENEQKNIKNNIDTKINELKQKKDEVIENEQKNLLKLIASINNSIIDVNSELVNIKSLREKFLIKKQDEILDLAKLQNFKIDDLSNPHNYLINQKIILEQKSQSFLVLNKNLESEISKLHDLKSENNIYNFVLKNSNYKEEIFNILSEEFLKKDASNLKCLSRLVNENIYDIDLSNVELKINTKNIDIILSEKISELNINLIEFNKINNDIKNLKSSIESLEELINDKNLKLKAFDQEIIKLNNFIIINKEKILQSKIDISNLKDQVEIDFLENKNNLENQINLLILDQKQEMLLKISEREKSIFDNDSLVLNEKIKEKEKILFICQNSVIKNQYAEYLLNKRLISDIEVELKNLGEDNAEKTIKYEEQNQILKKTFIQIKEVLLKISKEITNLCDNNLEYEKELKFSEDIFKHMKFCNNIEDFLLLNNNIEFIDFNLDNFKSIVFNLNELSENLEKLFENQMTKDEIQLIKNDVLSNKYNLSILNIFNIESFFNSINLGRERYMLLFYAELNNWVVDIKIKHIEQLINDYFIELSNLVEVNNNYCNQFLSFIKEFNREITKQKNTKIYSYGGIKNLEFNISVKNFYSEFEEKRNEFIDYFKDKDNDIREFIKNSKEFIKVIKNMKDNTFNLMNSLKNENIINQILLNGRVIVNGNLKELNSKNLESDVKLGTSNGQYQLILYKLFLSFIKGTLSLGDNDNILLHIPFDESLTIDSNNLKEIFEEFNDNNLFFFGVAPHANPVYLSIFNYLYFIKNKNIILAMKGNEK